MRALLDTNAYTALMRGEERIASLLDRAEIVYLSVVVAGELFAGFKGGMRERENRDTLMEFIEKGGKTLVLQCGLETAERFGQIKELLRKRGRPIPVNDVWIAAHCMETGSVLVTYDTHFGDIEGLLVWNAD